MDSESSQNEGTIYMESGSKLSFSFGDNPEDYDGDYIIITPFSKWAIYGEESTTLILKNKADFMLNSDRGGGFYVSELIIEDSYISDNIEPATYPSLQARNSITITKRSSLELHSVKAGKNIIIGEKNDGNSGIYSTFGSYFISKEIEAEGTIEINSGIINIIAESSTTKVKPMKFKESLKINGGIIIAAGTDCMGNNIENSQKYFEYYGNFKKIEIKIPFSDTMTIEDYNISYIYVNVPEQEDSELKMKVDGNYILNSQTCYSQDSNDDSTLTTSNPQENKDKDESTKSISSNDSRKILNYIYLYIILFLLF